MNELGEEVVHKYQGKEPSGRKIDDIALDHHSKHFNTIISFIVIPLKNNYFPQLITYAILYHY